MAGGVCWLPSVSGRESGAHAPHGDCGGVVMPPPRTQGCTGSHRPKPSAMHLSFLLG